jgi:adenylate cyclase
MSASKGVNLSAGFLVGRDKELATFLETFDEVIDGKGSRVLAVFGEAGVGKTRLVGEFLELYEGPGAWVLKGRCLFQERETPYRPFIDVLQEHRTKSAARKVKKIKAKAGSKTSEAKKMIPEEQVKKVSIDELLDKAMALRDKHEASDHDIKEQRDFMFKGVTQTIKDMAKKDPVILFLDDLHWADTASIQLLEYIINRTKDDRVLFVVAYRSEEIWDSSSGDKAMEVLKRVKEDKHLIEISVKPLDRASTKQMAQYFLRIQQIPDWFATKVHKETEGNPYFIEEVLKGLVEQGLIRLGDLASVEALDVGGIGIPSSLSDAVQARVQSLGPDMVKIAQTASVIGDEFASDTLLEALAPEKVSKDMLTEALDKFMMLNLIVESPSGEKGVYVFKHNIIQAVIYDSLSRGKKRMLHKDVATIIEKNTKKMTPRVVYGLANHFAIGHVPEKAIVYNTMAGDKASSTYALDEAIYFYTQALDFLELASDMKNIDDRRMVLFLKIGDLYRFTGRWDKALELYGRLQQAAKEANDIGMMGMAIRKMGHIQRYRGNWGEAEGHLNEALALARKDKDELAQADCERGLGYIDWRIGDYEGAIKRLKDSLEISEKVGDYYIIGRTYIELGNVFSELGEFEMAEKYFKRAIGYLEGIDESLALARVYNNMGVLMARTGDMMTGLKHLTQSIELYEAIGTPFFIWRTWCNIAACCSKMGKPKEAQRAIENAEAILKGSDDRMGMAAIQLEWGLVYLVKKDWSRSEQALSRALDGFSKMGLTAMEATVHEEFARMYVGKADKESARDHLELAEALFKKIKATGHAKKVRTMLKLVDNDGPLPP